MIAYITGTVLETNENHTIIVTGGVGYQVYATATTLRTCIPDTNARLHIHTVVREQALDLYGFAEVREKQLFELLITISGIGPKVALAILQATTPENLIQAVVSKDSSVLTKVSGIGKKNAEKIILELENKIDESWINESTQVGGNDIEVFEALEALGYQSRRIQEVLATDTLKDLADSRDKIKVAIKLLSR